jgi:aarF domain-containing kinase
VTALGKDPVNVTEVSEAMRVCGFATKYNKDEITAKYGALFFDDDSDSRRMGCATPQIYLLKLGALDPLVTVPDAAVFVARTSWMFRAMGSLLDEQIRTAKRWSGYAEQALRNTEYSGS